MQLRHALWTLGFCTVLAHAQPQDVKRLQEDVPPPVAKLMARIVECNHWAGEEPYDKQRAEEIRKAVQRLRCSRLDSDEKKLLGQYPGDKNVADAIAAAKRLP
jgi:hypothetical protein